MAIVRKNKPCPTTRTPGSTGFSAAPACMKRTQTTNATALKNSTSAAKHFASMEKYDSAARQASYAER